MKRPEWNPLRDRPDVHHERLEEYADYLENILREWFDDWFDFSDHTEFSGCAEDDCKYCKTFEAIL